MQTFENNSSKFKVVSFNPAVSQRREKLAVQLIKELGELDDMPNNMAKIHVYEQWRERALELAAELTTT